MTQAAATIGHNRAPIIPPDKEEYKAQLETEHAELFARHSELAAAAETVPDVIADDETQGKASELIKSMRLCESDLEARRGLEKTPWTEIGATVDAIFKNRSKPMEAKRKQINERVEARTKQKAAQEAARLAEEQERRKAAAAAALEAAERAERERKEAELDRMVAEAERDHAIWERDNAQRLQREAEQKAAAAKAEAARLELARAAAREEDERREEERKAEIQRIAALKAETAKQQAIADQAKLAAAASRDAIKVADAGIINANQEIRAAVREEKLALGEAGREEKRAARIEERIDEGGLGRHRSEHGALATTGKRWVSSVFDRNLLDKEAIWPFISGEEIDIAVRKWMLSQSEDKRSMPGAVMEQIEEGRVI